MIRLSMFVPYWSLFFGWSSLHGYHRDSSIMSLRVTFFLVDSLHKDGKLEKSHGGVTLWAMNIPLLKHHYSWLLGGVSMVPKHYPLWSFLLHLLYIIIIYYYYYEIILLLSLMILLLPPMGSFRTLARDLRGELVADLQSSLERRDSDWLLIFKVPSCHQPIII